VIDRRAVGSAWRCAARLDCRLRRHVIKIETTKDVKMTSVGAN
jgi:hypothetical protein